MAKEVTINVRIDTRDGEKSVGSLNKEFKTTLITLRDMEEASQALTEALKDTKVGTDQYKQLSKELIKVNTEIKNQELALEALDHEQVASEIKSVVGGLTDMAGGFALVGVSSQSMEEIVQTIAKVEGISRIATGAMEGLASMTKLQGTISQVTTGWVNALGIAQARSAAAANTATKAQKVLNAVMKASPLLIFIGLLTGVAYALNSYLGKSEEVVDVEKKRAEAHKRANKAIKEEAKSVGESSAKYVGLIMQLKNTNKESSERDKLIKEINSEYGTTLKNLQDETLFQNQLNESVKAYIEVQRNKFKIQKNETLIAGALEKEYILQKKVAEGMKIMTDAAEDQGKTIGEVRRAFGIENAELTKNEIALSAVQRRLQQYGVNISNLTPKAEGFTKVTTTSTAATKEQAKAFKDATPQIDALIDAMIRADIAVKNIGDYNFAKNIGEAIDTQLDSIAKTGKYSVTVINELITKQKEATDASINSDAEIKKSKAKNASEIEAIDLETKLALMKNADEYADYKINTYSDLESAQEDYADKVIESDEKIAEASAAANAEKVEAIRATAQAVADVFEQAISGSFEGINAAFATLNDTLFDEENGLFVKMQNGSITAMEAIAIGIETTMAIVEAALNAAAEAATAKREAQYEAETESLKANLANRTISEEEYNQRVTDLNQQREQEDLAARRKAFKQQKAIAIVNAVMQTAQAVMAAFSSAAAVPIAGIALGPIMAGVAGALGATQIGIIASQQFKAARGGVVPGMASKVDSVSAQLAPGEMVINSESSAMFPQLLSEINQAGGGISLAPSLPNMGGGMETSVFGQQKQETVRAIVVETDVTRVQNRVSRIERNSEF